MGYVSFRYRPRSVLHQLGCLVQGIAPLIAGGAILSLVLDAQPIGLAPDATIPGIWNWIVSGATETLQSVYALATSGLGGFSLALLLLCICLHSIPSVADIKISLGGFLALAIGSIVLSLGFYVLFDVRMSSALELRFVALAARMIENGLWWLLSASVAVVTVAMAGSFFFVIAPALVMRLVGSREKAPQNNAL